MWGRQRLKYAIYFHEIQNVLYNHLYKVNHSRLQEKANCLCNFKMSNKMPNSYSIASTYLHSYILLAMYISMHIYYSQYLHRLVTEV